MKGIWKDGRNLFRRDNNVHWRGHYGREVGITGVYGWREYIYGRRRSDERREVIRGMRRNAKAETAELLAQAAEIEEAMDEVMDLVDWADYSDYLDLIEYEAEYDEFYDHLESLDDERIRQDYEEHLDWWEMEYSYYG